jgi:hypothetical protein
MADSRLAAGSYARGFWDQSSALKNRKQKEIDDLQASGLVSGQSSLPIRLQPRRDLVKPRGLCRVCSAGACRARRVGGGRG